MSKPKRAKPRKPEYRRDPDGALDEVIVWHPKLIHFERMSYAGVWCGITLQDGRTVHVNIGTSEKCRHKLHYIAEEDP